MGLEMKNFFEKLDSELDSIIEKSAKEKELITETVNKIIYPKM